MDLVMDVTGSNIPQGDAAEILRPAASLNYFQNVPKDYRFYNNRLGSFTHWKYGFIISPETLARGGFYYKGTTYESAVMEGDAVQCGFCSLRLKKWEVTDNPLEEHYKRNRSCPLIQYMCPV